MRAVRNDRRRLLGVLGLSVGSAVVLGRRPPSAAPPSVAWSSLEDWYDAVGPALATAQLVWSVALLVAAWLAIACLLQLAATLSGRRWLRTLADRIAPATLRGVATASLAASLALSSPAGAGADASPGTATLHPLGAEEVATTSSPVVTSPPAAPAAPAPGPTPADQPDEYVVERGDSYWTIADDRLAEEGRATVTGQAHLEYWQRLMAANADRLVDAGNPDLLYPGQVLVLPPLT